MKFSNIKVGWIKQVSNLIQDISDFDEAVKATSAFLDDKMGNYGASDITQVKLRRQLCSICVVAMIQEISTGALDVSHTSDDDGFKIKTVSIRLLKYHYKRWKVGDPINYLEYEFGV